MNCLLTINLVRDLLASWVDFYSQSIPRQKQIFKQELGRAVLPLGRDVLSSFLVELYSRAVFVCVCAYVCEQTILHPLPFQTTPKIGKIKKNISHNELG